MRDYRKSVRVQACAVMLLVMAACSDDGVTDPAVPNTLAIEPVTSVWQSGTAGMGALLVPTVRVKNGKGDPVGGVVVAFEITGGGQVAAQTAHTDLQGRAGVGWWMLGTKSGVQSITAVVVGLPAIIFEADARAGPVAMIFHDGDLQAALPGTPLSSALSVRLIDQHDNPVSGFPVSFTVAPGGGTIANGSTTTDANGVAKSGAWTLGSEVGPQHVYLNLTPYPAGWSQVIFTAHACERLSGSRCETGQPPVCSSPADCGEIAFVTSRDGNAEIYSVNRDGSRVTRLTNNPATDENPAWSPDGRRIAFISDRSGTRDLYLMNADGTNVVRHVSGGGISAPSWSPDGSEIAYSIVNSEYSTLFAVEVDAVPLRGRPLVIKTHQGQWGSESEPSWSPDGKRIAMKHWADDESSYVATVSADGSGFKVITNGWPAFNNPSWSPDGTKLAVNFFSGSGVQIGIIDANNSLISVTTTDLFGKLSWSPDGRTLAFSSRKHGSRALSWVEIDGSDMSVITTNGWDPDWRR